MPDLPTIPDPEPILVATLPPAIADLLAPYTTARTVSMRMGAVSHVARSHMNEFDMDEALQLLPEAIRNPLLFGVDDTPRRYFFLGEWGDKHLLFVSVKVVTDRVPNEIWINTFFKYRRRGILNRGKIAAGLRYVRSDAPEPLRTQATQWIATNALAGNEEKTGAG